MITLTPDEERFIERQRQGSQPLGEHDRARAIASAQKRQDAVKNGEDPGESPHLQALRSMVADKALDHSIRLKNLRHHATWNWQLIGWAASFSLAERLNAPRITGPLTEYLTNLTPLDALTEAASGGDAERAAAKLFTDSLAAASGFDRSEFRWHTRLSVEERFDAAPVEVTVTEAGTFTGANGLRGYYLATAAASGTFLATSFTDPVTGTWQEDTWQSDSASGSFAKTPVPFSTLANAALAEALTHHDADRTVAFWYDQVVNPTSGSAVALAALEANLASATAPATSPY